MGAAERRQQILDLLCQREIDPLLYSPDLVGEVVGAFEELLPYYRYFLSLEGDPDPRDGQ